jgi:hypothetical protein
MERKKTYSGGCGCALVVLGAIVVLVSVVFAAAMVTADVDASKKHEAWINEYNEQVAALDSIGDEALRDSLVADIPQPYVRQGGFASMFGLLGGLAGVVVGAVPLTIGIFLIVRHRRRKAIP